MVGSWLWIATCLGSNVIFICLFDHLGLPIAMDNKIIIGHILSLVIQLLLSGVWVGAYRSYG